MTEKIMTYSSLPVFIDQPPALIAEIRSRIRDYIEDRYPIADPQKYNRDALLCAARAYGYPVCRMSPAEKVHRIMSIISAGFAEDRPISARQAAKIERAALLCFFSGRLGTENMNLGSAALDCAIDEFRA